MSSFSIPPPTGTDWTLLFKFHKTTIVLPIDPTEPFPQVKTRLWTALISTPNLTQIRGVPIPTSPEEIQLAILNKALDTGSGWKSVEDAGMEEGDGKTANGTTKGVKKNCPKGVGLKDGGILAFRFGDDAIAKDLWPVKFPSFDEVEEEDEELQQETGDEEEIPGLAEAMRQTAGNR